MFYFIENHENIIAIEDYPEAHRRPNGLIGELAETKTLYWRPSGDRHGLSEPNKHASSETKRARHVSSEFKRKYLNVPIHIYYIRYA